MESLFRKIIRQNMAWNKFKYISSSSQRSSKRYLVTESVSNSFTQLRPPLPVRVTLVAATAALATPAYTAIGVYRLWSSILPQTLWGKTVKGVLTVLIGGSAVTLVFNYVLPYTVQYSDIIAPFALANGAACAFWYTLAELVYGLDALAARPLVTSIPSTFTIGFLRNLSVVGGGIGVLTALTAPLMWTTFADMCWPKELREYLLGKESYPLWLLDMYYSYTMPLIVPVGFVSGVALQTVMQPIVVGTHGLAWGVSALPLMCAFVATGGYMLLKPTEPRINDFMWIARADPITGRNISTNIRTNEICEGHTKAMHSINQRTFVESFHSLRNISNLFLSLMRNTMSLDSSTPQKFDNTSSKSFEVDGELFRKDTHTVSDAGDLTALYLIVDSLVRYKYLKDLENAKVGHIKTYQNDDVDVKVLLSQLRQRVKSEIGEKFNIDKAYEEAETACILLRRLNNLIQKEKELKSNSASSTTSQEINLVNMKITEVKTLLAESRKRLQDMGQPQKHYNKTEEDSTSTSRSAKSMRLLTENFMCFENELKSKLNYEIPIYDEKIIEEVIVNKKWEGKWGWRLRYLYMSIFSRL